MLGWTLNMLASARKTWLRWTLQMLASTCKKVSWYVIALRLALAGCAAQSPTSHAASTDCSCGQGCSLFESAFYVLGPLHNFVLNLGPIQLPPPWLYSTRSCSVFWSSTLLEIPDAKQSYTFFQLSTWYHFVPVTCQATFLVPKTVVISHPTGSLQYFTSHYSALQKKLYSRAF